MSDSDIVVYRLGVSGETSRYFDVNDSRDQKKTFQDAFEELREIQSRENPPRMTSLKAIFANKNESESE